MLKAKRNLNSFDRIVRFVTAILLLSILLIGRLGGIFGAILGIFALVFAITSISSYCPLYGCTGISTFKSSEDF